MRVFLCRFLFFLFIVCFSCRFRATISRVETVTRIAMRLTRFVVLLAHSSSHFPCFHFCSCCSCCSFGRRNANAVASDILLRPLCHFVVVAANYYANSRHFVFTLFFCACACSSFIHYSISSCCLLQFGIILFSSFR